MLRSALNGWQLSGITRMWSGMPLDITMNSDVAGIGGTQNQRPNAVSSASGPRKPEQWFNINAFARPATGTFGNLGRNALLGPGVNKWDLAVFKLFKVAEKKQAQFRWEVFNAFNHPSFTNVGTTLSTTAASVPLIGNFGVATTTRDARVMQVSLKLMFQTGARNRLPWTVMHRRLVLAPLFLIALASAWRANVPPLQGVRTEEGQLVAFPRGPFLQRELSKKLPLDEPWPAGPDAAKAAARFGIDKIAPQRGLTMPSQIATDVFLVGQAKLSNLTYMIDCGPEGVAIIDPTYDSEFEATLANVEKCGRARRDIRWVINTHCHTDHSWADHKFRAMGAEIIIHEADAEAVEKGTQVTGFLRYNLTEFPRCPIGRRLSDGEILQLGTKSFQVIHTPGHTPGSTSFLLQVDGKNLLFSGDTVFYDGMLGWQQNPYADNRAYLRSLEKLEHFMFDTHPVRWDVLLPGHGAISLDEAYLDVQKARERIEHDLAIGREVLTPPYPEPEYRRRMFGRPPITRLQ